MRDGSDPCATAMAPTSPAPRRAGALLSSLAAYAVVGVLITSAVGPACDGGAEPAPTVRVELVGERILEGVTVCFSASVTVDGGAIVTEAAGDLEAAPDTLAEILAVGALCVSAASPSAAHVGACDAGASHLVTACPVAAYDDEGDRIGTMQCAADAAVGAFDCAVGAEVVVRVEDVWGAGLVMPETHQGIMDVWVYGDLPRGAVDACYDLRVEDGEGVTVWGERSLCASRYGNPATGDLSYIGACNAAAPAHTVTVWTQRPAMRGGERVDWQDPCPGATAADDPADWEGGCAKNVTCVEDADVHVSFEPGAGGER